MLQEKKKRILASIKQSEQEYQKSNFELQRGIEGLSSVISLLPEKLKDSFALIGQLHDDDIWLQLPEFISVLLCLFKFVNPAED